MRDQRRDNDYFTQLLADLEEALAETQQALDDGEFTSLSEQVDTAQQLYQLAIMRAVAHYSYGGRPSELKPYVLAILPYRIQLSRMADKLPEAHQCYRWDFEQLGGVGEACGSANINRYVYVLWWLALLNAVEAEQPHQDAVLAIIGEQGKDALLDTIAVQLGDTNRPVAQHLYYPEPYQTLLSALQSQTPAEQVDLLNQFIAKWYDSLDDADWFDNDLCECEFVYTDYYVGYWCFEAALVANLLEIEPAQLKPHPMLPVF